MKDYLKYTWDTSGFKLFLGFNGICLVLAIAWILQDGWFDWDVQLSIKWLGSILGIMWAAMLIGNYVTWRRDKNG